MEEELERGGQVYFVHNRVESIWSRAALMQQLVPSARIGVGHGQMGEAELEKVMLKFMRHEYDFWSARRLSKTASISPRQHHHHRKCGSHGFPSCISFAAAWAAPTGAPMPICWCRRIPS